VACLATVAVAAGGGAAIAYWSVTDSANPAEAVADVLPTGTRPAASINGTTVTLTFSALATSVASGSVPLTSYRVTRYDGTAAAVGATVCVPVVAGGIATCTLASQPAGTWWFSDTPLLASWVGGESPRTAAGVTVSPSALSFAGATVTIAAPLLTGGTVTGLHAASAV